VALIIAPPGSSIEDMDKLKGHRIGVIGGDANTKIVDVLSKEYGFDRTKVFKDIALPDAAPGHPVQGGRRAADRDASSRKISVDGARHLPGGAKGIAYLDPDRVSAIAETERAYESFAVPKGTLRGATVAVCTTLRLQALNTWRRKTERLNKRRDEGWHRHVLPPQPRADLRNLPVDVAFPQLEPFAIEAVAS
jgi:hypothetical protein